MNYIEQLEIEVEALKDDLAIAETERDELKTEVSEANEEEEKLRDTLEDIKSQIDCVLTL